MSLASAPQRQHAHRRRKDAGAASAIALHVQVPDRFKLTVHQKKQYATVAELKPDWTEDEILDFCKKCDFSSHVIQEGLANAFEDSRPHKEACANDWNTVDKKPRKAVVESARSGRHHDDEGRHNNRRDNNNRERRGKDKESSPVVVVAATSSTTAPVDAMPPVVGDSRVEEGAPEVPVDNNSAPSAVDNNRKPPRAHTDRRSRVYNNRKGSVEKPVLEGEELQSKERRYPRVKKQSKVGEQVVPPSQVPVIEKATIQDKYPTSKPVVKVNTNPPQVGPKPTYAGLFKKGIASVVPEIPSSPVVLEQEQPAVEVVIQEEVVVENVVISNELAAPLVEELSVPMVSEEVIELVCDAEVPVEQGQLPIEHPLSDPVEESAQAPVSAPLLSEASVVSSAESTRVAIIEDSDAYLHVTKSSATPPTPIGPTPKKNSHVQMPSLKSSASRSVWRVKENQTIGGVSAASTVTPPPSPAQEVPKQTVSEVDVSLSDSKLFEQSQEIIKDISSRAIQKSESGSSSKEDSGLDSSTFEFGFGLTSGTTPPPSFAAIPETVVPLPHDLEGEQVVDSPVYDDDQDSAPVEGFENDLADDVFGQMDNYEFGSQHMPIHAQFPGYRGVPGVLPSSPYMMHSAGGIPAPYIMMYEPDGSAPPNFYDPYSRGRAPRGQSRARQGVSKQGSHPSATSTSRASASTGASSSYRPKTSHQKARGDRRDNRMKDSSENSSFSDSSIPVHSQVNKDNRAPAGSSSSVIGAKRQGGLQRGNYMQAPHQVPGPMMYPYPYAMPYSPQYAPVPFPGYVYAGPAGTPYNYMYAAGPAANSHGFEDEFNAAGYGDAVPSPDVTNSRGQSSAHESPRQHPGAYPHHVPLGMFDAASWHHPDMLNDPSVAAAAADYSMAHMMNAPAYMDMQSGASNMGSGSTMGYDPREFNGAPASSGSYYRISPFNNASAGNAHSGSNNNGSSEQSQTHHGLSFQQWNHHSQ